MRAMTLVALLALAVTLTGCGQKYPQSYGLYMRDGLSWTPADSTQPFTVSEKPEFLIFDARLPQLQDKPDVSITFRPMKWIRWNINALVAQRDAVPRVYEKTKAGSFLPSELLIKMSYSPVKNHREMLIATPTTALVDGYYVLDSFGDRVICRRNVTEHPDDLPDDHVVDKWSVTHDENAGFSWDAFLAASQNSGRAVLKEGFAPPRQLADLLATLRRELLDLVSDNSAPAVLAFCQRVEKLDAELYASARTQCFTVIESEIAQAKAIHDLPTAIGIGDMATNAGFASDLILKDIQSCSTDLDALEAEADATVAELRSDMTNAGTSVASFTRSEYLTQQSQQGIVLTDTHINYISGTWFSQSSTWMGSIISLTPTKEDGWAYKSFGVKMVGYNTEDPTFNFATETERDTFLRTLTDVWGRWKKRWMDRLAVEVIARPHYWSERVFVYDVPYTVERISGSDDVLLADVELGASDPQSYGYLTGPRRFDGSGKFYAPPYPLGGQFRVKSAGPNPVTLRIRFCPAVTSEKGE